MKPIRLPLVAATLLLAGVAAARAGSGDSLPVAKPASVGLSAERLDRIAQGLVRESEFSVIRLTPDSAP